MFKINVIIINGTIRLVRYLPLHSNIDGRRDVDVNMIDDNTTERDNSAKLGYKLQQHNEEEQHSRVKSQGLQLRENATLKERDSSDVASPHILMVL